MLETPDFRRRSQAQDRSGQKRLVLVGDPRTVHRLRRLRVDGVATRLPIVGAVSRSGRGRQLVVHPASQPVPVLGRIERLVELVRRTQATDLIMAARGRTATRLRSEMERWNHADNPVRVHWVEDASAQGVLSRLSASSHAVEQPAPWGLVCQRVAKRVFDVFGSAVLLLILLPLLIGVSCVIVATTGQPIFYTQERVGQGGRRFRIWKFRSMCNDAETATGPIWAEDHDRRCTPIGDWLRHTNIDELPQLWNVLLGDMSLVGPRPERPVFVERFKEEHPDYDLRHAVPVGMTGWAQVHGWRGRTSLRKRIQYDLDYINRWSFWLDLKVLIMTIEHVFWGRTSWTSRKNES